MFTKHQIAELLADVIDGYQETQPDGPIGIDGLADLLGTALMPIAAMFVSGRQKKGFWLAVLERVGKCAWEHAPELLAAVQAEHEAQNPRPVN